MKFCVKFKYSVLSIALFNTYLSTVNAQTADDTPIDTPISTLSDVVVTANRLPQTVSDSIANISIINRTAIDNSGASDLPTLLLNQAGIELGRNGGVGQVASIFMRGMPSRNTLVLIDGVAINTQQDGAPNLAAIDLSLIERIEIVRGNVSAVYGSNASGGVIQIFTKSATIANTQSNQVIAGDMMAAIGNPGQNKLGINLNTAIKNTAFSIGLNRSTIDNDSAQRVDQNKYANPDLDGSTQTTARFSVNHRLSSALNVGLKAFNTHQYVHYDGFSAIKDDWVHSRFNHRVGTLDWTISPNQLLRIRAGQQKETAANLQDSVPVSNSHNRRQTVNAQYTLSTSEYSKVLLGIDHESVQFASESFGLYGSKTPLIQGNFNALFAGWQNKIKQLNYTVNIRRDNGRDNSANTYSVGLAYDIHSNWSLRASQSTAFNRPTFGQLYQPIYGNLALVPEKSRNQELSVQWRQSNYLARLTAFRAKIDQQFGFDPITYQTINSDKTHNQGIELLTEQAMPWNKGILRIGFNSHRPINRVTGQLLARRAKQQLHIDLLGAKSALNWGININYVSNRLDTDYTVYPYKPVVLHAYTKIDTHLGYQLNKQSMFSLNLNNLSRVNDASAYGYSGSQRSIVLQFKHTL